MDFRKAFKHIGELRALVDVPRMALTASAPPLVESDIIQTLHLSSLLTVSSSLDQPNIYISASPICSLSVSMAHLILVNKECSQAARLRRLITSAENRFLWCHA